MRNLSDPDTELRNLFPALGATVAQVAPVADVQARLFGELADTFGALNRDPAALQQTIEETPRTLAAATASFRVQTPFLARLRRRLAAAPAAAAELRGSLPAINARACRGRARVPATPELSERPRAAARGRSRTCPRARARSRR